MGVVAMHLSIFLTGKVIHPKVNDMLYDHTNKLSNRDSE